MVMRDSYKNTYFLKPINDGSVCLIQKAGEAQAKLLGNIICDVLARDWIRLCGPSKKGMEWKP